MALGMLESGFASCSGRNDHNRMASASRMPITSRKVPASRIQTLKKMLFSLSLAYTTTPPRTASRMHKIIMGSLLSSDFPLGGKQDFQRLRRFPFDQRIDVIGF